MLRRTALLILALGLAFSGSALAQSQPDSIEKIEVQGLFRMTQEAFRHALGLKEGDPYDPQQVLRRYKELWKLGLFQDITL
jgi:outer membrane protein assembly factor BamA